MINLFVYLLWVFVIFLPIPETATQYEIEPFIYSILFWIVNKIFDFNQEISFTCEMKTMHFKLLMMGLSHKIQITIQMHIIFPFFLFTLAK